MMIFCVPWLSVLKKVTDFHEKLYEQHAIWSDTNFTFLFDFYDQ
jgi:hypothetical protein